MADFGQELKSIVMKGVEVIGSKASNLAASAKNKVDELNLQNQRDELINRLADQAVELLEQGKSLPEELLGTVESISELNRQIRLVHLPQNRAEDEKVKSERTEEQNTVSESTAVRTEAQTEASPKTDPDADAEIAQPQTEELPEEPSETGKNPMEEGSLKSAIDDLFNSLPPVDKMAEKVNSALDEMGENLRRFSSEFGKKVEDLTNEIMKDDEPKDPE